MGGAAIFSLFQQKNFIPNQVWDAELHVPLGEMPLLELLNCMGIRHHCLFLEVTDETVASLR